METGKKQIGKFKMDKTRTAQRKNGRNGMNGTAESSKGRELCSVFGQCGGCSLLDVSYEEQLRKKQQKVSKLLKDVCPKVHLTAGMEDPFHYRNKVHAVFGRKKDGTILAGTYRAGTHFVIPVKNCMIENAQAGAIVQTIRELAESFKLLIYNEDTGRGLLRHVLIRTGHETGQILVALVTSDAPFPSRRNFVKELVRRHPEITTIVQNFNTRKTSIVMGEQERVLYGSGTIEDVLCGCRFRISASSFYQVNPLQTRVLYEKAISLAGLTGTETVIDAYCGIGTIGLIASTKAGKVLGIERNPQAVKDAIYNVKANQADNVRIVRADATEYMERMAKSGERADIVMMDPPREGSTERFMKAAAALQPSRIVYVSCDPMTLARDLKYFQKIGYITAEAWPVDMFPHSEHVETVCLLSNRKADSHIKLSLDMDEYYDIIEKEQAENK